MLNKLLIASFVIHLLIFGAVHAQPSVDDFNRESDYRMASISPNGQYLAEVWNKYTDNTRIVTIRDISLPEKPVIGQLADRVVRPNSVSWANDERLLINVSVPYNTESVIKDANNKKDFNIYDYFMFSRTIAVNADASNPVTLLDDKSLVKRNRNLSRIKHYLPDDPDHILMIARKADRLIQYKVNVYTGKSEPVITGTKSTFAFLNDKSGKPLYRLDYRRTRKRIDIYEPKGEDWQLVDKIELDSDDDEELADRGDFVGLYKDELVYRKKNEETGFQDLWTFNSKTKEYKSLVSLNDRDVLFALSRLRTDEVVGYGVDGDIIRYRFFDKNDQERYDELAKLVGDYNFSFRSWSKDADLAVIQVSGQDNPSSFSLYNFKDETLTFLQNSYFSISTKNLSLPAKAQYKARDGLLIDTYILLPNDYTSEKKYPMVVLPHGGPQARDRAEYDDFAQFVSTRGYIVIRPNFRGSIGYGKAFEESGYKQWGGKMQDDLEDAVTFMVERGYADPNKVCIAGFSYGGYAALMGVVKTPKLYQCAISLNGVTDLPDQIKYDVKKFDDDEFVDKYIFARIGDPKEDLNILELNSPARHVDKIQVPLLIVAGTDDDIVPIEQAKKLVNALKKHKKEYEFLQLKDTGHNPIYYPEDILEVYTTVERFLAQHLK